MLYICINFIVERHKQKVKEYKQQCLNEQKKVKEYKQLSSEMESNNAIIALKKATDDGWYYEFYCNLYFFQVFF